MSYNKISTSDGQALEKQTSQLEKCKALQETMKAVNAHWRKYATCVGAPGITGEQAKKLDEKIATTRYSWERVPFSTYDLTNNNSTIKRLESKVREVSKGFNGWEFIGGRAEANTAADRLQIFFNEPRLSKEQHMVMRRNGFVYSPTNEAYQRQLTENAIYSANRIDFIKPSDGRSVRDHQPKMPVRDEGAR